MKDNLTRLVPAVEREMREAESRRQRRRAELELDLCRRRTESILEAAGEGICGLDAKGVINFINPLGAKLVGWEAGELIGKSLHETIHYSRANRAPFSKQECSLCATLRDGLAHWMDDEVFCRKDGSAIPVEYTCVPMHEGKTIVGAVLTFQDITERKDAEEASREANRRTENSLMELRRTQQQIVEQERLLALGRMAGAVTHDFNNALSKMLGLTELLLTSPDKLHDVEKVRKHLRMINSVAQDAANIVRRLREFYRPRRDTEQFNPVDLKAIVEEVIALTEATWKHQTQANGVSIQIQAELKSIPLISADEAELREVLTNLIFNAVDAMPEGGIITIRTLAEAGCAVLEVGDTGTGMTDEVRQHCFEPFFSTKDDAGTGLGLALVYGIIQRHRGEIRVESESGRGTNFIIRLPLHSEQHAQPHGPKQLGVLDKPLHVLVVEDEPMIRDIEAEYLTSDGHVVETAADGSEGLRKFRAGEFDLVLVDRAMPQINGDQLTEAIKEVDPDTPVILVTSFVDTFQVSRENTAQANLVLAKPFSQSALRQAVQKVMVAA